MRGRVARMSRRRQSTVVQFDTSRVSPFVDTDNREVIVRLDSDDGVKAVQEFIVNIIINIINSQLELPFEYFIGNSEIRIKAPNLWAAELFNMINSFTSPGIEYTNSLKLDLWNPVVEAVRTTVPTVDDPIERIWSFQ